MKRKQYVITLLKNYNFLVISIGEYVSENEHFISCIKSRYKFPFYKESISKLFSKYIIVTYKEALEINKKYISLLKKYEEAYQEYKEGLYEIINKKLI